MFHYISWLASNNIMMYELTLKTTLKADLLALWLAHLEI